MKRTTTRTGTRRGYRSNVGPSLQVSCTNAIGSTTNNVTKSTPVADCKFHRQCAGVNCVKSSIIGLGRIVALWELANRLRWLALCLPLAAALLVACAGNESANDSPEPRQTAAPVTAAAPAPQPSLEIGHKVGQRAPDFTLTTAEGEVLTLDSFRGRPVVLYFFCYLVTRLPCLVGATKGGIPRIRRTG